MEWNAPKSPAIVSNLSNFKAKQVIFRNHIYIFCLTLNSYFIKGVTWLFSLTLLANCMLVEGCLRIFSTYFLEHWRDKLNIFGKQHHLIFIWITIHYNTFLHSLIFSYYILSSSFFFSFRCLYFFIS